MHEFALADEIAMLVSRHAAEAQLGRVTALTLALGSLALVEREALFFALEAALRGGIADGTRVVCERVAARARCPDCGLEQPIAERFDPCAGCGAYGLAVLSGTGLTLQSIEGSPREE